jgi:hypothetical protein
MFPQFFVLRDGRTWVQNHESFDPAISNEVIAVCIYGAISIEGPGHGKKSHKAPSSRGRGRRRGR